MPAFLAFVPPVVWRWLAILGVLVAAFGAGWYKGLVHQQEADELAASKLQFQRAAADAKQAAALRPIATQYVQEHANETAEQPAVESGIIHFVDAGRQPVGLRCPGGTAHAAVPNLRTEPAGAGAPAQPDAGGAVAAQAVADKLLTQHIAMDASLYRICVSQLDALQATAKAAGADTP